MRDHEDTKQCDEVKESLEYELKFMVEYFNGGEKIMN